jgi:hypothetical protein
LQGPLYKWVDGCEASPRFGVKNRYKPGEQRTLVLRLREVDALTSFPWKTLWSHSPQAIVFVCFGGVNTKKAGADNDQTVNGRRRLFYIVNPTSLSTSSHSTAYYVRHRHQPWNILVKTPGVAIKAKMGRTKLKRAARAHTPNRAVSPKAAHVPVRFWNSCKPRGPCEWQPEHYDWENGWSSVYIGRGCL